MAQHVQVVLVQAELEVNAIDVLSEPAREVFLDELLDICAEFECSYLDHDFMIFEVDDLRWDVR